MFQTNDPHQKERRQELRNDMPPAEKKIWRYLRGKQLQGMKFRRQFGVGPYILDFYCPEKMLCVEIDGESHFTDIAQEYDKERTDYLNGQGIHVLRYTNIDVYENIDTVIEDIIKNTPEYPTQPPRRNPPALRASPLKGGTGEEPNKNPLTLTLHA